MHPPADHRVSLNRFPAGHVKEPVDGKLEKHEKQAPGREAAYRQWVSSRRLAEPESKAALARQATGQLSFQYRRKKISTRHGQKEQAEGWQFPAKTRQNALRQRDHKRHGHTHPFFALCEAALFCLSGAIVLPAIVENLSESQLNQWNQCRRRHWLRLYFQQPSALQTASHPRVRAPFSSR